MSNIFKKKVTVYNILSELMDKLDSMENSATWNIGYYTDKLKEIEDPDEDSWTIQNYHQNIADSQEQIEAIKAVAKYLEQYK